MSDFSPDIVEKIQLLTVLDLGRVELVLVQVLHVLGVRALPGRGRGR